MYTKGLHIYKLGARKKPEKSNRKPYIMTTFADENKLKEI